MEFLKVLETLKIYYRVGMPITKSKYGLRLHMLN